MSNDMEYHRRRNIAMMIIFGFLALWIMIFAFSGCSQTDVSQSSDVSFVPVHGVWNYVIYDTISGAALGEAEMRCNPNSTAEFIDPDGSRVSGKCYVYQDNRRVLVPFSGASVGVTTSSIQARVSHGLDDTVTTDYKLLYDVRTDTETVGSSTVEYSDGKQILSNDHCQRIVVTTGSDVREYFYVQGIGMVREIRNGKLYLRLKEYRP